MESQQNTPILGRHGFYKAAQNRVVEWLVHAAYKTSARVQSATVVDSRQLLSIAQILRESGTAVPRTILDLLFDVIEGRQSCADWFSSQSTTDTADNERHRWFIGTLRKVHAILLPLTSAGGRNVNSAASRDMDRASGSIVDSVKANLVNYFAQLEVVEPSDTPLGRHTEATTARTYSRSNMAVRLEDDKLDTTFAIWCQLEDQCEVRHFVTKIWRDVAANSISLTSASAITDTAVGLMRVTHDEFVKKHHYLQDYWHLLRQSSLEAFNQEKLTYVRPKKDSQKALTQDVVKQLCPAAAFLLKDMRDQMKVFAETETGKRLLRAAVSRPTDRAVTILESGAYDFHRILKAQAPELLTAVRHYRQQGKAVQSYNRREFIMGIAEYYETNILPSWLVVACAIHMDIYEVVGQSPGCAAKAWIAANVRMENRLLEINAAYVNHPDAPFPCWFQQLQPMFEFRRLLEPYLFVTDKILQDNFGPLRSKSQKSLLGMSTSSVQASPCVAGSQMWDDRAAYHRIGLRYANEQLMGLALATLYNATKRLGLISSTWVDMETVIHMQKTVSALVPKSSVAGDIHTLFRHYLLALGVPITQVASYDSTVAPKANFVNQNCRKLLSPTSAYIVTITNEFHANDKLGLHDRGDLITTVLTKLTEKATRHQHRSTKPKHSVATESQARFTVTELLSTLKEDMVADEVHLNFDYPGFYMAGESIREQLMAVVPKWKGRATSPGCAMWEIVFYILRDAANTTASPKSSPLLVLAAAVLKQYIENPGMSNKFDKEARNQSSGHIPKSLAPVTKPYDSAWIKELWQSFLNAHESAWEIDARLVSYGASHLTFYNREGHDEEFETLTSMTQQFWRIWDGAVLTGTACSEDSPTRLMSVETVTYTGTDGVEVDIPLPISIKTLGCPGYEKVRQTVVEQFLPQILETYR